MWGGVKHPIQVPICCTQSLLADPIPVGAPCCWLESTKYALTVGEVHAYYTLAGCP